MLEWNQPDARELVSLGSLTCGLWCLLSSGCTSARRKREAVGRFACPKFLTKHENSPKYFIQASGTSALNLCYSIKAQLREIIMINFTFGVRVKTRLPLRAWMLPVMRKHSFDIRASSLDEAVSNVRTRIDLLLDILR